MLPSLNRLNRSLHRIPGWLLFCSLAALWLTVQVYFFQRLGVKLVPDSIVRYIPYANHIAETGQLGESQENRYILYILFLAFFIKLKLGLGAAVLAQIAASGIACILLFRSVRNLTNGNRLMAVAATTGFILWKDVQYLNVYILTESLFTSSILYVIYPLTKGNSSKHYAKSFVLSLIPMFLRPNGFIVLLGIIACWCYSYRHMLQPHKKAILLSFIIALSLLLFILDSYLLTTFQIVETYARGEIIYASGTYAVRAQHVVLPAEKSSPILRILFFVLLNPVFFAKIFFLKFIAFIGYIKPYYSLLHNVLIICFIYPLYLFAGYFIIKSKALALKAFPLTVFLLQATIVAMTSEDWDSRFIIPLLPMFMLFGITGLYGFIEKKEAISPPLAAL
ncbi:hypothetical protein I2I11_18460 [Pontibacter sp. 172403-2]|uniref:hypothetical protein n=1 Tax=Pontibacter rufus TaxID=2791028 RepID=UPI0018AF8E3C|nr:hypothetical protein [Pontibacter sp. 172403-2]MBF9255287.1 hypothetical protein [Pontibacter sp. 172403-2]